MIGSGVRRAHVLLFGVSAWIASCFSCSAEKTSGEPGPGPLDAGDSATPADGGGDTTGFDAALPDTGLPPPGDGGTVPASCAEAESIRASIGCRYYAVAMDAYDGPGVKGGCFAAFLANVSATAAHFDVRFDGKPIDLAVHAAIPKGAGKSLTYGVYSPTAGLAPGEVVVLSLSGSSDASIKCPRGAAVETGAQLIGTGLSKAFRIESDVPVVAYQMFPYGGGNSTVTGATLLLPTSVWGTNYIAVDAFAQYPSSSWNPSLDLVAHEDGTEITLLPKVAVVGGGGVASASKGVPVKYTLSAGQVLQITQPEELTGSPLSSNKPIGLYAGHHCMTVPALTATSCDHAEQQVPPIRALGSEYVAVGPRARSTSPEAPVYRLIGAVDGTKLTFEPSGTGPAALALGEVAEITTATPFVVRSQDKDHPFLLASYMTSSYSIVKGYGDPDFVRVVPSAQYLRRTVFLTDPTYPETNLVVVRRKGAAGFSDVTLDCAGPLAGWTKVGASDAYEWTRVDLVKGFSPIGKCDNGRHEMSSAASFAVTVWGWGTPESGGAYTSYGYPAGESVALINDVVVPPIK